MKYAVLFLLGTIAAVGCANLDLLEQDMALEGKIAKDTVDAIVSGAEAICKLDPSSKVVLDDILATEGIHVEISCK